MHTNVVDIEAFQMDTGLDDQTLKELYLCFVEEMQQYKEQSISFFAAADMEELKKLIHNIKGVSGNYRSPYILGNTQNIYIKLKNNEKDSLEKDILELNQSIDEALAFIKQYFK